MKVCLIGPPACGKGTFAQLFCDAVTGEHTHLSSGDLVRKAIEQGRLSSTTASVVNGGNLLPDDAINRIVLQRLRGWDCFDFVLDGYPRTIAQAKFLEENRVNFDLVVWFDVDDATCVERSLGRKREDDTEESIKNRIQQFKAQTEPLHEYYARKAATDKNFRFVVVGKEAMESLNKVLAELLPSAVRPSFPRLRAAM